MVEEDAVARVDAIGFAVVNGYPVAIKLSHSIGATWVERGRFFLRDFLYQAIELGSGGLVEAGLFFQAKDTDGFEDAQGTDAVGVRGVFWRFEADSHVTHGSQVVDFVWLDLLDDANEVGGVGQVTVVQDEVFIVDVRILIQMVNTVGIEQGCTALDAVDDIAFTQ